MLRYALALTLSGLLAAPGAALLARPAPQEVNKVELAAYMDGYMQGSIVALDSDAIRVKPMGEGNEAKVKISDGAMIRVNGSMATFEDLRVGHLVSLMTETEGGVLVASMVDATSQM